MQRLIGGEDCAPHSKVNLHIGKRKLFPIIQQKKGHYCQTRGVKVQIYHPACGA